MSAFRDKTNTLVSVIVPVYDVEKYIDRCIRSILNQTYKTIEIILVDDGSPDKCPLICDEWAKQDSRIRVIHKENGGLSSARNAGIEVSNGAFLVFVDSDDWISEDCIDYLYRLMIENDADMVMGNHACVSSNKEIFSVESCVEHVLSGKEFLYKLLKVGTQENVQYAWGKMYKNFKDTDIRYPEGLIDEDVPTTFKYACFCKKIVISNKVIYAYYENKDSILRKNFNKKRFDLIEVWKQIMKYAEDHCDKDIVEFSVINYYRAHFGLLCNICTEQIDKCDAEYVRNRERELLKVVRENKRRLLKFNMPISRKIVVCCFCINYALSKKILKMIGVRA